MYLPNRQMAAAALAMVLVPFAAAAQDCAVDKDPKTMSGDEISALYDCMKDGLAAGYAASADPRAAAYRGWTPVATRPAAPGTHSGRFLMTFVDQTGAAEYLRYAESGVNIPVGTEIAKESFGVKDGKAVPGPLFFMTKVGPDAEGNSNGWFYSAVMPDGQPMAFEQKMCHDCHSEYLARDYLGYPAKDVRIAN
jgi:hypothetical protein